METITRLFRARLLAQFPVQLSIQLLIMDNAVISILRDIFKIAAWPQRA
jgi:hypothetical protein